MKKIIYALVMALALVSSSLCFAAEQSSDKMILDWKTNKVWVNDGELCVTGAFFNRRSDLTVTKLNNFVLILNYERADGTKAQFVGNPKKLPMCKVMPNQSRRLNFNFGKFKDTIKNWSTAQEYVFTYINGARW